MFFHEIILTRVCKYIIVILKAGLSRHFLSENNYFPLSFSFKSSAAEKDDECTKSENVMLIRSSSYWYSIGVRSLKYILLYAHNSIFSDANQTDHTRSQFVNGQNINHLQSSRVCVYIFVFVYMCMCGSRPNDCLTRLIIRARTVVHRSHKPLSKSPTIKRNIIIIIILMYSSEIRRRVNGDVIGKRFRCQ